MRQALSEVLRVWPWIKGTGLHGMERTFLGSMEENETHSDTHETLLCRRARELCGEMKPGDMTETEAVVLCVGGGFSLES